MSIKTKTIILLVATGTISLFTKVAYDVNLANTEHAALYQRKVDECYDRGGIWTPVGGDHIEVIYGCVFPPVSR